MLNTCPHCNWQTASCTLLFGGDIVCPQCGKTYKRDEAGWGATGGLGGSGLSFPVTFTAPGAGIKLVSNNPLITTGGLGYAANPYPALAANTAQIVEQNSERQRELETQISELRSKLTQKTTEAKKLAHDRGEKDKAIAEKNRIQLELQKKTDLRHILDRVCDAAQTDLLTGAGLLEQFESKEDRLAFVMSIDVRRSTELMLKARSPQLFADFITNLCMQLRMTILGNFGVFDKFTGDGILAFFPEFYSGNDAALYAVKAADECHRAFATHYRASRGCFDAVIADTGLGIGIDFGPVRMVRIGGDFTVVGKPVVYACRMGAAKAGTTLLNQPAFDHVFKSHSAFCTFEETEINFKHEANMVAYSVKLNGKELAPRNPEWLSSAAGPVASNGQSDRQDAES